MSYNPFIHATNLEHVSFQELFKAWVATALNSTGKTPDLHGHLILVKTVGTTMLCQDIWS